MKQILCILFFIFVITSCDCYQMIDGIVIDKETNKPIVGAILYVKNKEQNKALTDSIGYFQFFNISGGFTCPPMNIIVEYAGYKIYKSEMSLGKEKVIYLEKQ
ncbi:MAG: carboxypeptidase-like regulatory domain-containing protein [Dysgonomonas sp.]